MNGHVLNSEYSRGAIAITDLKNFISPAKHNPIAREIVLQQQQLKASPPNEIAEALYRLTCSFLDLPAFSGGPNHGANRQQWVTEFAYRLFSCSYVVTRLGGSGFHGCNRLPPEKSDAVPYRKIRSVALQSRGCK